MNCDYPHEILPGDEIPPELRDSFMSLSEAEGAALELMTPDQRNEWLQARLNTERADLRRRLDDVMRRFDLARRRRD